MPATVPLTPLPKADQELPFQRAMFLAGLPPAKAKVPPAYRMPPGSITRASTEVLVPFALPVKEDQTLPFQRGLHGLPTACISKESSGIQVTAPVHGQGANNTIGPVVDTKTETRRGVAVPAGHIIGIYRPLNPSS